MQPDQFTNTLTRLLRSSRLVNWPRRKEQKDVLIASVAMMFRAGRSYSEPEVNDVIGEWFDLVGKAVQIDHANICRALIDEGYLTRDRAGLQYELGNRLPEAFVETVVDLDVRQILRKE